MLQNVLQNIEENKNSITWKRHKVKLYTNILTPCVPHRKANIVKHKYDKNMTNNNLLHTNCEYMVHCIVSRKTALFDA